MPFGRSKYEFSYEGYTYRFTDIVHTESMLGKFEERPKRLEVEATAELVHGSALFGPNLNLFKDCSSGSSSQI